MTSTHSPHRFRAQVRNPGPHADKGHSVACTVATCTESIWITANGTSGPHGLPTDVVLKKATQKGWLVRKGGRSITCPGCQGHRPKPAPALDTVHPSTVVAMTREAHADHHRPDPAGGWDRAQVLEAVPAPAEKYAELDAPADTPPPVVTYTPTTPALRRAINAQLHEVHAGECGYLADWSDAKVAKGLDCSPAAVAAIREDLFGPDTNEEQRRAAAARDTELAGIRQLLAQGQAKVDQSMGTLAEADRLYADAMARLAKIEGTN